MLNRLPRQMPPLSAMLDDIGNPTNKEVARAVCISEGTVRKWLKLDRAPHAAMLALFWVTRSGISAVGAEARNAAVMSATLASSRLRRIGELESSLNRLGRIAQFGSANDSTPETLSPRPAVNRDLIDPTDQAQPVKKLVQQTPQKPGSTEQPCGLRRGQGKAMRCRHNAERGDFRLMRARSFDNNVHRLRKHVAKLTRRMCNDPAIRKMRLRNARRTRSNR